MQEEDQTITGAIKAVLDTPPKSHEGLVNYVDLSDEMLSNTVLLDS